MSHIRFIPVSDITGPLNVTLGLSGASGTGKTYTALLIARGMAEAKTGKKGSPIAIVDTENRRALHYKSVFPEMVHFDMKAVDEKGEMVGFGPERWISVIDAAEAAGVAVLVVDSFSHAWEGVGGVLDLHAITLEKLTGGNDALKDKRSQLAWAEVKPRYRKLVDRIVRAKCDMVICTRAKPVMQAYSRDAGKMQNARNTKTRRADVPWDPAADGDLMFEMTAMMILDPSAPGCPVYQVKCADQFKALFDPKKPMAMETGYALAKWAMGEGDAQRQKDLLDQARKVARGGRADFLAYWSNLSGADRAVIKTILAELEATANDADREAQQSETGPFGAAPDLSQPQDDATPSAEEMARAMAEAEEAARLAAMENDE